MSQDTPAPAAVADTKTLSFARLVAAKFLGTSERVGIDPAIIAMIIQIITMFLDRCQKPQTLVAATREAASNELSRGRALLSLRVRDVFDDTGYVRGFGDVGRMRDAILMASAEHTDDELQTIVNENLYLGV